jgi:hypothetical protein
MSTLATKKGGKKRLVSVNLKQRTYDPIHTSEQQKEISTFLCEQQKEISTFPQ